MDITSILEKVDSEVFGIWFLIGAALVFFMQCGFAMVETGFTRAKNAGNIIMKNLMDFCIGTCVFIPLGFGIQTVGLQISASTILRVLVQFIWLAVSQHLSAQLWLALVSASMLKIRKQAKKLLKLFRDTL